MTRKLRLLVADDHPLYLEAVRVRLERLIPEAEIVEAVDFAGLLAAVRQASVPFDLALVDYRMPGLNGAAGIRNLVEVAPQTAIVVMSGSAEPPEVRETLRVGARGYLPKTLTSEQFSMALGLVRAGGTYAPVEVVQHSADEEPRAAASIHGLTQRERDVLGGLARGLTNKAIANELGLAEITIKLHVRQILRKLNARNRSEASIIALRTGLI